MKHIHKKSFRLDLAALLTFTGVWLSFAAVALFGNMWLFVLAAALLMITFRLLAAADHARKTEAEKIVCRKYRKGRDAA